MISPYEHLWEAIHSDSDSQYTLKCFLIDSYVYKVYFKQLYKVLENPDDFPDAIKDLQKQLGIDVGIGFKSGGLAGILEV